MRVLQLEDIHHTLVCKLVEVEAVADIVVGRYRLGVVVYHHRAVALTARGEKSVHRAPVELNRRADAVCARAEHHHRAVVAGIVHIILGAVICEVEVVCGGRIFCGKRVNLLHHRYDTQLLTPCAHRSHHTVGVGVEALLIERACHLEVTEALLFSSRQQACGHIVGTIEFLKFFGCILYIAELVEEPAVNLGKLVYAVYGVALRESLGNSENAAVGRLAESGVEVVDRQLLVLHEAVHALPYHAEALLNSFLKSAADSHNLAHRFHRRTDMAVNAVELAEVPTGYFHHHVVQRRLKEGRC